MTHTKDILAEALRQAAVKDAASHGGKGAERLHAMSLKAAEGYYHDFLSPLDTPCLQLAADLAAIGSPAAMKLRARHIGGEFDATKEESDAWADSPEGKAAFNMLAKGQ